MTNPTQAANSDSTRELARYLPGHLVYPTVEDEEDENRFYSGPSITWCTFDPTGNFLLCNMGGEQVLTRPCLVLLRALEILVYCFAD